MSGTDCICIMPTGGGKSLCFQLPAICTSHLGHSSITLVVSPLVSLVEDQLWQLARLNIHAETLNASSSKDQVKRVHDQMLDKHASLRILYVTPEKLAKSKMFMNKLQRMYELSRFGRLVIDEVHCCSTYGHDFRPDYKFLNVIKGLFPKLPVLGLTATATQTVIDDLKKILNIPKCVLFKASFNRPNIFYECRPKPSNHSECMDTIADLILTAFGHDNSGIVYCLTQKETEQVFLKKCRNSFLFMIEFRGIFPHSSKGSRGSE
jgi:ATP-dependent DNA helicase Q1